MFMCHFETIKELKYVKVKAQLFHFEKSYEKSAVKCIITNKNIYITLGNGLVQVINNSVN